MRTYYSLPLVLLILVKNAATTSIAEQVNLQRVPNFNPRPMIIEQPTVHLQHESIETDQEDTADDAELSPSEIIETHVLPETSDPDDPAGAMNGAGPGVQRVRRRRRRRRRKRPKPTVAAAPISSSEATTLPGKSPNSFDTHYGLAEDEIRRKPFKYVRGETDETVNLAPSQPPAYGDAESYPRKRIPKRRRRPLKRPIDDYPPVQSFDEDITNSNDDDDNNTNGGGGESPTQANKFVRDYRPENTTTAIPTSTTTMSTSIHSRKPDFSKLTTALNRNKLSSPSSTENIFQSTKPSTATIQPDSENSIKKQKNPPLGHKIQHDTEDNSISPNHQRKQIDQNVVRVGHEENSKTLENKKEFFKPRRLPPTWAILGHSKFGQTAKNESVGDKIGTQNNPKQETRHNDQTVSAHGQSETITSKTNLVRESEPRSVASFKTSTTVLPPTEETEPIVVKKSNNSKASSGDRFSFPIITTYDAVQGQEKSKKEIDVNSNTSAFLSSNDQRLTIIYVPCNQTVTSAQADQLFKNGAFFRPTEENVRSDDEIIADSSTQESRKISTTRLPSTSEHQSQTEESVSEIEDKLSSTVRSTTSVSSSTTQSHSGREAKRYQEDVSKSKSKSESDKEDQPSWQIRKSHPSPSLIPPSVKPFPGSSKEIIISYTSTTNSPPSLFSYHNIDSADEQISLHLRNRNSTTEGYDGSSDALLHRKISDENAFVNRIKHHQHQQPPHSHHVERKKLPLAVKSAIIISGAVLALAVLGFFALLLSCKIRQAKSRMKCHRQLYRDQFQSSEFRQSSRSTSPVMSKSNYNTRNFTNNMQPANIAAAAAASNRNYYLWQTLRKTFQYD